MDNLKYLGCVTLLGILACASTAIAQTIPEPEPIFSPRFGVRYTTEGAGYESFSTFEGFLPVLQTPGNSLTFLQGKVLLDNDSNLASNILFGHRFFSQKENRIIGGYISYSTRDTGRSNFDQLGLGFETLGSWDFRFNAYLPLNSSEKQFDQRNLPFFQGNSLMIERSRFLEVAMSGVDAEVGTRLANIGSGDLRGYAGVYYYSGGQSREAFGWKTRIEARPNDYLGLSLSLQNDDLFDTRLVFSIGANFPGSGARRSKPKKDSALARMGTTVENQATILVAVENRTDSCAATIESNNQGSTNNPDTPTNNPNTPTNNPNTPTNNNSDRSIIIHVAPGGTGNGTFEAPFGTIADALAVAKADNVIYVRSNPTTVFAPFTIPDGVRVFSSGPLQVVDVKNLGIVTLPLSGSGIHPTITGAVPTGNGLITLGNNTVISGFNIQIPGTDDARGVKGTNISNVRILDNKITNAFSEAIYLENVTGTLEIARNTITDTRSPAIDTSLESGIFVWNYQGITDLTITDNRIITNFDVDSNYRVDGIEVNLCRDVDAAFVNKTCSSNASITANILNNQIIYNGQVNGGSGADGIDLNLGNLGQGTFVVSGNTLTNIVDEGISINAVANSEGNFTIVNNIITNVGDSSIEVDLLKPEAATPAVNLFNNSITSFTITGNTLNTSGNDGIDFEVADKADVTVTIADNIIQNIGSGDSGDRAIQLQAIDNAIVRPTINSNTITNISGDAIQLAQVVSPSVTTNNISNTGDRGIVIETASGTTNISNNTLIDANQESIKLSEITGSTTISQNNINGSNNNTGIDVTNTTGDVNLTIANNQLAENFNDVRVSLAGTASGTLEINSNTITNNGTAVDVQLSDSTNLSSVSINNNQINGVDADITSNGINIQTFNDVVANNVTISGNTINTITNGDAINLQLNGNSSAGLTISSNIISNIRDTNAGDFNFTDGINLEFFDNINSTVSVTNNNIFDIAGRGISASNFSNTTTLNVSITDNQISNTTAEGIGLDDLQGNLEVVNNTIENTQAVGIKLSGGEIAKITDNAITNAGTQGIQVENSNGTINIDSNTITDANQESIALSEVTGTVTVNQNIINGLNNSSGIFTQNSTGNVDLTIGENTLSENLNDISVSFSGTASGTAEINNNTISNVGSGVDVQLTGSANFSSININNNQITGVDTSTASNGISFQAADDVIANNVNISSNTINTTTNKDGVNIQVKNNSQTNFTISANTITNVRDFNPGDSNLTDGINLEFFDDNVSSSATISNNVLSIIDGSGIHAINNGNDSTNSVQVTITGNQFSDIDSYFILIDNISDYQF
ncbi:MAG: right-handed parallel beta-helix repeat-containing protein [Nostoc sp. DcaGUA01]|nr:right-handed parallel beta-helix repeat-containing protein [Nostoc sp. DcaGUA01]